MIKEVAMVTTPAKMACVVVAKALRAKFPEDRVLADRQLFDKHGVWDEVARLSRYFEAIQESRDGLDQLLLDAV
jgi:hypothetical protein